MMRTRLHAGQDNGRFLGHLANGMPKAEILKRIGAGEYPHLHPNYLALLDAPHTQSTHHTKGE